MKGREAITALLNVSILLTSSLVFSTVDTFLLVQQQFQPVNDPQLSNYFSFILNSEIAFFFVAGIVTALVSLTNCVLVCCSLKSMVLLNVQFFGTAIMGCIQAALLVVSGVDNMLFQERFNVPIQNYNSLNNLQTMILFCLYSSLCFVFPATVFLMYLYWVSLSQAMIGREGAELSLGSEVQKSP